MGVLCSSLFLYALLYVLSSFAIILKRKIEPVSLLLLLFGFLVTVNVMWLFLTVLWCQRLKVGYCDWPSSVVSRASVFRP